MQNYNSKLKIFVYVGLCAFIFGFMVAPFAVRAGSFVFQDKTVAVKTGEIFTVSVSVDPAGAKQYTARFTLNFPPDMLEVTAFELDHSWLAVSQAGYNLIDNNQGVLIKTAGYPAGFATRALFGTVTFRAKSAGEGAITVGKKSFILNAESKSTLSSRPQMAVAVADASAKTLPTVKPLTDLPVEEPTLFDIISEPGKEASYATSFFILWIVIMIAIIIIGALIIGVIYWWRRKWLIKTLKQKDIR